jgi:hypothetical protein
VNNQVNSSGNFGGWFIGKLLGNLEVKYAVWGAFAMDHENARPQSRNIRYTITPEQMEGLLKRLENLPPKTPRITSLAKLVESLHDAVGDLRDKGYSWQNIATMLEQECDFEILPNTVRDSYSRSKRKRLAGKNQNRSR